MEDTHRDKSAILPANISSLNPCSNGRYSQRIREDPEDQPLFVLILVLMEDTHRGYESKRFIKSSS